MNFCEKCGKKLVSGALFCDGCGAAVSKTVSAEPVDEYCEKCGSKLADGVCEACLKKAEAAAKKVADEYGDIVEPSESQGEESNSYFSEVKSKQTSALLVDSDEEIVSTLGNGYITNMLIDNSVSRSKAMLTDKRIYFSGKCLVKYGRRWNVINESRIIDVQDVTGTGFVCTKNIKDVILAIFFLIAAIVFACIPYDLGEGIFVAPAIASFLLSIGFAVHFFLTRRTVFEIEYAGGRIGFDVKWLNTSQSIDFQKQVHAVKEKKLTDNMEKMKS